MRPWSSVGGAIQMTQLQFTVTVTIMHPDDAAAD